MLQWLLLSAITLTVLASVCAHVPNRAKLLGLFSVGSGLMAGWALGRLARLTRMHFPQTALWLGFTLISMGQIGTSFESYRLFVRRQEQQARQQFEESPTGQMFLRLIETQTAPDDVQLRAQYEEIRDSVHPTFERYLSHRVFSLHQSYPALRTWPQSWPAVLWGIEIVLSAGIGAWLVFRAARTKFCETCNSWCAPQRSVVLNNETAGEILELLKLDISARPNSAVLVVLSFVGCRCSNALPEIRCVAEQPNRRTTPLGETVPDREALKRLLKLLNDAAAPQSEHLPPD